MPFKIQKTQMKNKRITNLAELRQAKKDLKIKMELADKKAKDGLIFSAVNKLFNSVEDQGLIQNSTIGSGVHSALNFLSGRAENQFNLGKTGKLLLSTAIIVGAPIIAKKLQEFVDHKFDSLK